MTNPNNDPVTECPCCSGNDYKHCCEPLHLKKVKASNPEQLMRSRFTAFYLGLFDYLIETHHQQHLCGLTAQVLSEGTQPNWLSLEVISSSESSLRGKVTFQAWFKDNNQLDAIHESSDFIKENGSWYYTEGVQHNPIYPKRNELCVCGSKKKFKQCCL